MTPLPLRVNIFPVVGLAGLGIGDAWRVTRRWPDLTLERILAKAKYLYLIIALRAPSVAPATPIRGSRLVTGDSSPDRLGGGRFVDEL